MTRKLGKTKERAAKLGKKISLSRQTRKAGLAELAQRVTDLVLAYVAVGRLTPGLRRKVVRLRADVDIWRARTGSDDIRATQSAPVRPAGRTSRKAMMTNGGGGWCHCSPIMISRGRLCFLVDCDASIRWCSYVCFDLPTNGTIFKTTAIRY